jgi:hypothetical protein
VFKLDSSVRLVLVQFSFSNPDAIPPSVRWRRPETQEERVERKDHVAGVMIVQPTEGTSLAEFPRDLEAAGYKLVDAFCKERINDNPHLKRYHMVRFIFARREHAQISQGFWKVRDAIRAEFQGICGSAMWRVRVFDNPFYQDEEEVSGRRTMSINLEVRQPLFVGGQPVMVWQRDDVGRRVGSAPIRLTAKRHFRVVAGEPKIMES